MTPGDNGAGAEQHLDVIGEVPRCVLVVRDLHLGYGTDLVTGRYDCTENFFADAAFNRLLEYYDSQWTGPALLLFNGDTFNFLRISTHPATVAELEDWSAALEALDVERTADELRRSIASKERKFGLRTDDFKSVWKFLQIARGHPTTTSTRVSNGGMIGARRPRRRF